MDFEMEKRLHRVKIKLDRKNVKCPNAKYCAEAESCDRCNVFYEKCAKFTKKKE